MAAQPTGFQETCSRKWSAASSRNGKPSSGGFRRRSWGCTNTKGANALMVESLLDACQFVLDDQGEPQSSYWLASEIMEMKLWKASDADVRDALNKDIEKHGEQSQFVRLADDV